MLGLLPELHQESIFTLGHLQPVSEPNLPIRQLFPPELATLLISPTIKLALAIPVHLMFQLILGVHRVLAPSSIIRLPCRAERFTVYLFQLLKTKLLWQPMLHRICLPILLVLQDLVQDTRTFLRFRAAGMLVELKTMFLPLP